MTVKPSVLSNLAGVVLLGCAAYTAFLVLKLLPLLGGASWQDADVAFHLATQAVLLLLPLLAGVLILSFSGWWRDPQAQGARAVFQVASWLFRLVCLSLPLAFIAVQLWGHGDPYGPSHQLLPGVFSVMSIALTVLFGGPLCVLAWAALNRLNRWMKTASTWSVRPGASGELQRVFRELSHPLLAGALVLAGVAAFLLPVQLIDRAPAIAIQTPLQVALIDQQPSLMHVLLIAALSGAVALWFWRVAARDRTHDLDPQHSRIGAALQKPSVTDLTSDRSGSL